MGNPVGLAVTFDVGPTVHQGDVGRNFVATIQDANGPVNIASATALLFTFSKPSGKRLVVTPRFLTSGTDGNLVYQTVAGDLDEVGEYEVQATVVLPAATLHSDISTFSVLPNLI